MNDPITRRSFAAVTAGLVVGSSAELAAAAPRACRWLDSGEAIARRVAHLLSLSPGAGAPRARFAGFTDADAALSLAPALRERGFAALARIGAAPGFLATERTQL